MMTRKRRIGQVLLTAVIGVSGVLVSGQTLIAAPATAAPAATAPAPATLGEKTLAENLVALAQSRGRLDGGVRPEVVAQSVALLKQAHALNPTDWRITRLLADGQALAGQTDDQIKTLRELLDLDRTNTVAWCEMVDLYLSQRQSADAKGAYLDQLLAAKGLDPEVVAYVAFRRAQMYRESLQLDKARDTIAIALKNNPVDPDACWLNWQLVSAGNSSKAEKIKALMASVKASPTRPEGLEAIASVLAQAGLYDDSAAWYDASLRLIRPTPPKLAFDCALTMILANKAYDASQLVDQLLKESPNQADLQFLNLLVAQQPAVMKDLKEVTAAAKVVFEQNLVHALNPSLAADAPAQALPKLADLTAKVKAMPADQQDSVQLALTDLGWFLVYYDGTSPDASDAIALLKAISPADSVAVARLEGWNFLIQGKKPEARVKLEAVADRDPLAALGLLRMADKSTMDANAQFLANAHQLLQENPDGLVGAILATELHPQGVAAAMDDEVGPLRLEVRKFTTTWQDMLQNPARYFVVRGDPQKVAHDQGDPMLARIIFQNRSDFELSVGPDGVIHPGLWFDARIAGVMNNQTLPGCAFEQIRQRRVLHGNSSISQVIRLDAYSMLPLFDSNPAVSFDVTFYITSNPIPVQDKDGNPTVIAGAAGMKQAFTRVMQRVPVNMSQQGVQAAILNDLVNGDESTRFQRIQLLSCYLRALNQMIAKTEKPEPQMVALRHDYVSRIGQRRFDPSPAIAAWASYELAISADPATNAETIRQMHLNPNPIQRLLAVDAAARALPPQDAINVMASLVNDKDPNVAAFAAATQEILKNPATQPATQPSDATQPADSTGDSQVPASDFGITGNK